MQQSAYKLDFCRQLLATTARNPAQLLDVFKKVSWWRTFKNCSSVISDKEATRLMMSLAQNKYDKSQNRFFTYLFGLKANTTLLLTTILDKMINNNNSISYRSLVSRIIKTNGFIITDATIDKMQHLFDKVIESWSRGDVATIPRLKVLVVLVQHMVANGDYSQSNSAGRFVLEIRKIVDFFLHKDTKQTEPGAAVTLMKKLRAAAIKVVVPKRDQTPQASSRSSSSRMSQTNARQALLSQKYRKNGAQF